MLKLFSKSFILLDQGHLLFTFTEAEFITGPTVNWVQCLQSSAPAVGTANANRFTLLAAITNAVWTAAESRPDSLCSRRANRLLQRWQAFLFFVIAAISIWFGDYFRVPTVSAYSVLCIYPFLSPEFFYSNPLI